MTALLGLLAIAGYQNRDKLFKMLGDLSKDDLLGRLSRALPNAVDSYTPEGRLPAQASPLG